MYEPTTVTRAVVEVTSKRQLMTYDSPTWWLTTETNVEFICLKGHQESNKSRFQWDKPLVHVDLKLSVHVHTWLERSQKIKCWSCVTLNLGSWGLYSFMLEITHFYNMWKQICLTDVRISYIINAACWLLHTLVPSLSNLLALENLLYLMYKKKINTLQKNMRDSLHTISQWLLVFDYNEIHQQLYLKFKGAHPIWHPFLTCLTTIDFIGIRRKISCHVSSTWKLK